MILPKKTLFEIFARRLKPEKDSEKRKQRNRTFKKELKEWAILYWVKT